MIKIRDGFSQSKVITRFLVGLLDGHKTLGRKFAMNFQISFTNIFLVPIQSVNSIFMLF